jgi:hypothetical protein
MSLIDFWSSLTNKTDQKRKEFSGRILYSNQNIAPLYINLEENKTKVIKYYFLIIIFKKKIKFLIINFNSSQMEIG